ncbi:fucose mutarotase isoform X2 [Dipodomys spectabilis]|uniref:fucose mutarotase isoform X2 n=1 Tax=Dipodomys spectabilis TaxID=105255 RepID=UPI001C536A87|nr:fucose mutarotase isoform X2 [Dipodomys spectabilis]
MAFTLPLSVLADANFPTSSICQCGPVEIRADGLGIPVLLEAVLKLLPLDTYVESPAAVMELVPSDKQRGLKTPVWEDYELLLLRAGCTKALMTIERFEFYERAKKAFAVVATGGQGQGLSTLASTVLLQGDSPLRKHHPQEGDADPHPDVGLAVATVHPEVTSP